MIIKPNIIFYSLCSPSESIIPKSYILAREFLFLFNSSSMSWWSSIFADISAIYLFKLLISSLPCSFASSASSSLTPSILARGFLTRKYVFPLEVEIDFEFLKVSINSFRAVTPRFLFLITFCSHTLNVSLT